MAASAYLPKILPSHTVLRLKKRNDFLRLKAGTRIKAQGFLLIANTSMKEYAPLTFEARLGFTVTKKCGNAVIRNRIKRRLREATRIGLTNHLLGGHDYNVIGYKSSLNISFKDLILYLQLAVKKYNNQHNESNRLLGLENET